MYNEPEMTFMKEWYANMTVALQPIVQDDSRGVFAAACYTHSKSRHF